MRVTSGRIVGLWLSAIMLGLPLVLAVACDSTNPSIRIPIANQSRKGFSTSFAVPQTAVYALGLEFLKPVEDPEVDRLVTLAASKIGFPDPPTFDFTWRVTEGALTIGEGPGPDGATGVVLTGADMGMTERLKAEALLFGTFDGCAGRTYTLEFSPGPGLARVLSVSPVILIDTHHTLENDGRIHDDGPRLRQVCTSRPNKALEPTARPPSS